MIHPYPGRPTVAMRQRPGITWDDLEGVLAHTSVFQMENDTMRPWVGPPGQAWMFWNTVNELRKQQAPIPTEEDDWWEPNECE